MEIQKKHILELKLISKFYKEIHTEYDKLEKSFTKLEAKRGKISKKLNNLRDSELAIINKIKEETGITVDAELLNNLLNDEI